MEPAAVTPLLTFLGTLTPGRLQMHTWVCQAGQHSCISSKYADGDGKGFVPDRTNQHRAFET